MNMSSANTKPTERGSFTRNKRSNQRDWITHLSETGPSLVSIFKDMRCQTCPRDAKLTHSYSDNHLPPPPPLLAFLRTPLCSVNCPAPLQGDTYTLVLRPLWLLEFISVCVVFVRCRWDGKCSSYINNYSCFGIMLKKNETKKKEKRVVECCTDSTRNVVFLFCMRAQTQSGPLSLSRRQTGVKQTASSYLRGHEAKCEASL